MIEIGEDGDGRPVPPVLPRTAARRQGRVAPMHRRDWLVLGALCAVSAGALFWLLRSPFGQSAMVYVSLPALISLVCYAAMPHGTNGRGKARYWRHMGYVWAVFVVASVALLEGIICAAFFAPIYWGVTSLTFYVVRATSRWWQSEQQALVLPLLAVMGGLEGTTPALTPDRSERVTVTRVVPASPEAVWATIRVPDALPEDRHWFLSLFPLPETVDAEVIAAGETHVLGFTYHRWFVTNTHRGEMHVEVLEAGPTGLRTAITHDDSYLSHYMRMEGTELRLAPAPDGGTAVTLTIEYERALDPAWYFAPLQDFAVRQSARYLIGAVTADAA